MVQLIVGRKGKGKTRQLLSEANAAVKESSGNIVYLDKSSHKMFELNNKIRLIDVSGYPLKNSSEFVGFICGIISQDHDLEKIYLDSFLDLARVKDNDEAFVKTINELDSISRQFKVDFTVSVSRDKDEIAPLLQDKISVAL